MEMGLEKIRRKDLLASIDDSRIGPLCLIQLLERNEVDPLTENWIRHFRVGVDF
jgi:hypothetical protein